MTIEIPQTQLAMALAAAALSAAVLSAAAGENAAASERRLQDLADELALEIGLASCKGTAINLTPWLVRLPGGVTSVSLLKDRVRVSQASGSSISSLEFPALANEVPLELLGQAALHLNRDLFTLACHASTKGG